MVARGSPIGVKAAPKPIEKQVTIQKRTLYFLSIGRACAISTSTRAAIMAVIMLDTSPSTTITIKRQAYAS